ncbi:hypothetical protein FRX31_015883 [Thalictrum thalictroides]|uniref:Mediator complex subunit 15 KIX domain-containing protein n=1 Tax=Thalictrum thalictroides TaxID=46969 RepID=A0A7J6WCE3_THATH|nr:hypothetical protein FRX31_015883 [Thalictrum thalictroides]
MESNNDWRSELERGGARQGLVNNLVDTMKLQYPVLSSERLLQLQTSAVTFEQNVFFGATSQVLFIVLLEEY